MNFKITAFLCVALFPRIGTAQSDGSLIDPIMEYISENVSEDIDYSEIMERLNFYYRNPLNINKVGKEQLQELVFISPVQINNLISHRVENGLFQDLLELQSIDGFDNITARWLMNFVTLTPPGVLADISLGKLMNKSEHDLIIRFGKILEKQKGFITADSGGAAYAGSPMRILTRYRFNYANKILASLNMEKDPGEVFFRHSGDGFDFYSANVYLKGSGLIQKFIIGDYALQFGQGLTMWSGLSFGKGAGLVTAAKQPAGLRPYSSVNESSFLRGVSATINMGKISFTPFGSYKKLDASLSDSKNEINTLMLSGLHRTTAERENKNRVSQLIYGLNSQYTNDRLTVGLTIYRTNLSMPIAHGTSLYERYDFSGISLINSGFHYSYSFRNAYFFGEAARRVPTGSAFLNGLMASLSPQVSVVLLHRSYARNYFSFFNQGLSESTEASNEKGFYTGLQVKFDNKFELGGYFDFFRFPWLKFRVDAPSQGHELFAHLAFNLSKKFKLTGRFAQQQKEENVADPAVSPGLDVVHKQNYRIELLYKLDKSISLRSRAEMSVYKKGFAAKELGFLSYQDIIYNPLNAKYSANVRFAIFDTYGFSTRIYTYENDVLYGYSIPAYQGKGTRFYVNGKLNIHRGIDIWLRYALLSYSDQDTVGSAHDMISGNQRSDIKLQLRFQF